MGVLNLVLYFVMNNTDIANILEEIAELMELKGDNPFKIRAYYNGARVVEGLAQEIAQIAVDGKLREIKGIGEGLAATISELVKKGKSEVHEKLRKSLPAGILDLLRIQGLGPKRAKIIYEKLKVKNIEDLKEACQKDKIAKLEGFGAKTQTNILAGIQTLSKTAGSFLFSEAWNEANQYVKFLKTSKDIIRIEIAGSLRRRKEVVHDVDILISAKDQKKIHKHFRSYPQIARIIAQGDTKSSAILKSGLQIDLRTITNQEFPYALHHFTGSKEHNVAMRTMAKKEGLKISEYGIHRGKKLVPCKTEEDIYKLFQLSYISPELREDWGEIESARKDDLPELVEAKDIKGIFHVHSDYSDGVATLEQMIARAEELGYEYVGISDHSKTAVYANGLSIERLEKQNRELDKLEKKYKNIRIFRGIESDILQDGALDYPDKVLKSFDFVIGSIHSRFKMPEAEMTKRICRAIENSYMTIWGHPTGRLLLERAPYSVNFDQIFQTAKKHGVVVEINANPHRLDLDWRMMKEAKQKGLRFSINPDAHSVAGLSDVFFGVGIARKGWLEKKDLINTMSTREMEAYLQKRKS